MKKLWSKVAGLVLGSAMLLCATGCDQQQTAAELIGVVGTSVAALAVFEGNGLLATKLQTDFAAASAAVANWKSGTPAQDVVEALNLVEADLNLLPVSAEDDALITLAIGTVDQIFAFFPVPAPAAPAAVPALKSVGYQAAPLSPHAAHGQGNVAHKPVKLVNPPKTAKEFRKQWNAELARVKPTAPPVK